STLITPLNSLLIPVLLLGSRSDDAAKADVAGRGVDRLGLARGGAIAQAVVRSAQVRAALDHPPRDVRSGLSLDEALRLRRHPRVRGSAARRPGRLGGAGRVPLARPLPRVAAHVVQAVAVRREASNRGRSLVAAGVQVLAG